MSLAADNNSDTTEYQPVQSHLNANGLPKIDYCLREHKLAIAINWGILFLSSGVLPIVLYFSLRYGGNVSLSTTLGVSSAVFGVCTVFSLCKRTWELLRTSSTCRPLGASKWSFDFFHINFMFFFVVITAIVVSGNIITNIRVFAIGLPIMVTSVCAEVFLFWIVARCTERAPFRFSSVAKGEPLRSAVYVLAEDIIAVDAGQGQTFRQQFADRYVASKTVQELCKEMDFFWGLSGTLAGAGAIVALWVIHDANLGYILAWAIPWAYAAIMATFTVTYCQLRLKNEVADPMWQEKQAMIEAKASSASSQRS